MVTPGSIGLGAGARGATGPCSRPSATLVIGDAPSPAAVPGAGGAEVVRDAMIPHGAGGTDQGRRTKTGPRTKDERPKEYDGVPAPSPLVLGPSSLVRQSARLYCTSWPNEQ